MPNDLASLLRWRLIPVVSIADLDQALPLADALTEAGLPCAEITLRTDAALESIALLSQRAGFTVGVGTVHSYRDAEAACAAGARFVVTPGLNVRTVQWCQEQGVPVLPGIATPSDLESAMELGVSCVKLFPAEPLGGVRFLKALAGPYAEMRFVPTGGICRENLLEYLKLPGVVACGGSWMVCRAWLEAGDFARVTAETATALKMIAEAFGEREDK